MESESKSPRSPDQQSAEKPSDQYSWQFHVAPVPDYIKSHGITASLQHQLEEMHSSFLTASDSILAQISETGSQLEQLEKRIDELVKEAGSFRFSKPVGPYIHMQIPPAQQVNGSPK